MIDYIKILVKELQVSILEANPLLEFFDNINISTGEIKTINKYGKKITPFKNAYYKSLEIRIYDTGLITISGSLHKYFNSGAHNYNDFGYNDFLDVLNDLKTKFDINPQQCILRCLEVGVNITPPIKTNHILDFCFMHKTKNFEYQKNSDEGKYKQCEHSQYIIKLYNKALHYRAKGFHVKGEILRFEIKFTKMQRPNNLGIYTLNDIALKGFQIFKKELLTEWQNVLFYDTTINAKSRRLINYNNPVYWSELTQNGSTSNYYKHRKILKELTSNYSENIQDQVTEIISNKIDFLNSKGACFYPLTIRSILTPQQQPKNNICLITGINISMQKSNSHLLSHTGLKYYYQTDRKVYEQIKRKYLTNRWLNTGFQNEVKEIAHNIRNYHYNQQVKQQRLYPPNQQQLFEIAV